MMATVLRPYRDPADACEAQLAAMIDCLRTMVLMAPGGHERCHALFLDQRRRFLGEAGFGFGTLGTLSLRMRELFGEALRLGAQAMIIAHNHPSGHCQPSGCDIAATRRIAEVARALDIELLDTSSSRARRFIRCGRED